MIAATFLTDYLGVDWRHGARWFHDTLVDADLAINAMMWQNAGKSGLDQWDVFSGADATPTAPAAKARPAPWTARSRALDPRARGPPGRALEAQAVGGARFCAGEEWRPRWRTGTPTSLRPRPARYAEPEGRASPRATHRAPRGRASRPTRRPSRALPGGHRRRARRAARARGRAHGASGSGEGAAEPPPRDVADVLVDQRTGCDHVLVPEALRGEGARRRAPARVHAQGVQTRAQELLFQCLSRLSTLSRHTRVSPQNRRETEAESSASSPAPPGVLARNGRVLPAVRDRRLGRAAPERRHDRRRDRPPDRRRRAVRRRDRARARLRRREAAQRRAPSARTAHSHSHAHGGVTHSHSHGGHSHLPGDKIGANHIGHTHGGGDWGAGVAARKKKKGAPGGGSAAGKKKSEKGLKSSSWAARGAALPRGAAARTQSGAR